MTTIHTDFRFRRMFRGPIIAKHSISIAGQRTSISLEPDFWNELKRIHRTYQWDRPGLTLADLVSEIDATRGRTGLSSAVRLFVLRDLRSRAFPVPLAPAASHETNHTPAAGRAAAAPASSSREPRRIPLLRERVEAG